EGIMRRDPVGQVEEAPEEVQLGLAEPLDIRPPIGAPQGRTDSEDDDVEQVMALAPLHAWIGKTYKERCKKLQGLAGRHPSPPGLRCDSGVSFGAPLTKSIAGRIIRQHFN